MVNMRSKNTEVLHKLFQPSVGFAPFSYFEVSELRVCFNHSWS